MLIGYSVKLKDMDNYFQTFNKSITILKVVVLEKLPFQYGLEIKVNTEILKVWCPINFIQN